MFGFLKRKDKEAGVGTAGEEWGKPSQRKLSKDEAAREAAEQRLVEEKNRERRDMYRQPGRERIFTDVEGRRLALRTEINPATEANPAHPPVSIVAFWGTREIGHITAEQDAEGSLRQLNARIEYGYENRGIAAEILAELENVAREVKASKICCVGLEDNEWNSAFLTQRGFVARENELVKNL